MKFGLIARLSLIAITTSTILACGFWRIDFNSVYLRSEIIDTPEKEQAIVSKAHLGWSADGRIRVLYTSGTPYERGYQQGYLLRREVQQNLGYMHKRALEVFRSEELFDEAFERARPFIPQEYLDEMHGLAHGAKLPLRVIHHIHILPEISEWGGKKKLKEVVRQMMAGELGTSCSNLCIKPDGTGDESMYVVRILDWGLHKISKLHEYPLIAITNPEDGQRFVNIGWVGFLGAISGMNESGITLGEMGYKNPPNESLSGKPMPFLLRDILRQATSLEEVRHIITNSVGTNSFVFLMTDGKTEQAQLYVRDRDRMLIFDDGQNITDPELGEVVRGITGSVYGGHFNQVMHDQISSNFGKITPTLLMNEMIPPMAMKSNFQNVIYDPKKLRFWVANAKDRNSRAAEQPYTYFDFAKYLKDLEAR